MYIHKFIITAILTVFTVPQLVLAQVFPAEGSHLHYRVIGFSIKPTTKISECRLEICKGFYNSEDSFKKNITQTIAASKGTIIAEVPEWGAQYSWRMVFSTAGKAEKSSGLHHFSTETIVFLNPDSVKLDIVKPAEKYRDGYIFCDRSRVLYDMQGNGVWFLPNILGITDDKAIVRDLKMTSQHTITFLANDKPFEINYNADVLWRAPKNDKITQDTAEQYHHEFTRLSNGNYMIMGNEQVSWYWKVNSPNDSSLFMMEKGHINTTGQPYIKMPFGTIVEFDPKGKLVWSWRSVDYYKLIDTGNRPPVKTTVALHGNAFYFDEKAKELYVSFKNTYQVVKIKYPGGKILNVYGGKGIPGNPFEQSTPVFSEQHACKLTRDGLLMVYNNNTYLGAPLPKIMLLKQPVTGKGPLETYWEYEYPAEFAGGMPRGPLTTGGNVVELPDESIFVSMCSPYGNIFIVNREKQLLFDALLEHVDLRDHQWHPFDQYRASFINNRQELERLILK